MSVRKGKCSNIDGCVLAEQNTIQEIDSSEEFVCKECGEPLYELPSNNKKSTAPLAYIIGGGVILAAVVVGLIFAFSGGKDKADVMPVEEHTDSIAAVAETPAEVEEEVVAIEEVAEPEPEPVAEEPTAAPKAATPTLSYGKWTGEWLNGQPHGTGTMTYTTSHRIDTRDMKGRVAESGEYIIGEWDNGHLVQGRWFKNDGSKEAIIIGKAN